MKKNIKITFTTSLWNRTIEVIPVSYCFGFVYALFFISQTSHPFSRPLRI